MQVLKPPSPPDETGGASYGQALRRHWRAIAVLVVLAVIAATAYTVHAGKRYDAESVLFVTPLPAADTTLVSIAVFRESGSGAATSVHALGRLLRTPAVVDGVKKELNQPEASNEQILNKIKVKPAQQTATVSIVASDRSPVEAARIANAFADVITAQRGELVQHDIAVATQRLRTQLRGADKAEATALRERVAELDSFVGAGDPTIRILSRAEPPTSAASAGPVITIIVAIVAALMLGAAGAFALELLQPHLRADDPPLKRLPVLAYIPRAPTRRVRAYLNGKRGRPLPPDLWEAYRLLRAGVVRHGKETILVTSAIDGEGKTMTSVNLSIVLAASGLRVVLVDGNVRKPGVARVFGIPADTGGFADVLYGRADPKDVLVPAPGYGDQLRLLLPGPERPLDLLEPRRIRAMLDRLRGDSDVTVIDSPSLLEYADAITFARAATQVVVAVRLGRSRRDALAELERRLSQEDAMPVGFVVTGRSRSRRVLRRWPAQPALEPSLRPGNGVATAESATTA
jgi:Mrp family chromosome partitioning ATPase